jgi:uncharacterized membrane protein YeaQ/YmgE (transglycosylase-associated protein family)
VRIEGWGWGYKEGVAQGRPQNYEGAIVSIIILLIVGAIIGLLGKFVAPGDKDNIPLWLTVLCGIGGVLIGLAIYSGVFNGNGSAGVDWTKWALCIIVSAVLVVIASTVTGRNTSRRV